MSDNLNTALRAFNNVPLEKRAFIGALASAGRLGMKALGSNWTHCALAVGGAAYDSLTSKPDTATKAVKGLSNTFSSVGGM